MGDGAGRGEGPAAWLGAAGFLAFGLVATAPLAFSPGSGVPVAALFPPWWDAGHALRAVVAARAVPMRAGAWPSLVVAADAGGEASGPSLGGRLRAAGAWLILDPRSLRGCSLLTDAS